jgi:hypothetical protein
MGWTTNGVVSSSVVDLMEGVLKTMVISKLRMAVLALVAVGICAVGLGSAVSAGWGTEAPGPQAASKAEKPDIDEALAKAVKGTIARVLPVSRDCMILSYLPDWNFGNVDNLGVANNDGGVRTLLDWPEVSSTDISVPGRRFLLALYSRQTDAGSKGEGATINAHELTQAWPEISSWKTKPEYDPEPSATFKFEPEKGWKLFDITAVVQARAKPGAKGKGVMLRFRDEDRSSGDSSGYRFVSREGKGEWEGRHPRLLFVDAPRR